MSDVNDEKDSTYSWLTIFNILIFIVALAFITNYFFNKDDEPQVIELETPTKEIIQPVPVQALEQPIITSTAQPTETVIEETPQDDPVKTYEAYPVAIDSLNLFSNTEYAQTFLIELDILSSTIVFLDNFSRGTFLPDFSPFAPPETAFSVKEQDNKLYISQASYQRYDPYLRYIDSIDAELLVEHYKMFKPMVDEVYAEISRPGEKFEDVIAKVAELVIDTPIITYGVQLQSPSVMYTYNDQYLEELSDAQKFLLRLGPNNLLTLKNKINEIEYELAE